MIFLKRPTKLTRENLKSFEVCPEKAIKLIVHYASQYKGKVHYDELGNSCGVSATGTINTIIGSAEYLEGMFLMADTIDIEKLAKWFLENREYECDESILKFYMANYLKRKINELYRNINSGRESSTLTIAGNPEARKRLNYEMKSRKNKGVKIIRIS